MQDLALFLNSSASTDCIDQRDAFTALDILEATYLLGGVVTKSVVDKAVDWWNRLTTMMSPQ